MNLNIFAKAAKTRVEQKKEILPLSKIKEAVEKINTAADLQFEKALKKDGISFICEIKRASPSAGVISEEFPYLDIAGEYERAGADAVSVLTEPDYFKGSDEHLSAISRSISLPVLRKDFVTDEYQLYETRLLGGSAVLLIAAILDTEKLKRFIEICDTLGLSALVEAHTKEEISSALKAGARIIGVNNRNLNNFTVNLQNSVKLRRLVPKNILYIAESGIKTRDDIEILETAGVDGVLIGETLMRSGSKAKTLSELRGRAYDKG